MAGIKIRIPKVGVQPAGEPGVCGGCGNRRWVRWGRYRRRVRGLGVDGTGVRYGGKTQGVVGAVDSGTGQPVALAEWSERDTGQVVRWLPPRVEAYGVDDLSPRIPLMSTRGWAHRRHSRFTPLPAGPAPPPPPPAGPVPPPRPTSWPATSGIPGTTSPFKGFIGLPPSREIRFYPPYFTEPMNPLLPHPPKRVRPQRCYGPISREPERGCNRETSRGVSDPGRPEATGSSVPGNVPATGGPGPPGERPDTGAALHVPDG